MSAPIRSLQNRSFYHGDNLPYLRAIGERTIHLIATDPPFNKSRNFVNSANGIGFRDTWSWEGDVERAWIDQIRADHPALWALIEAVRLTHGDDQSAYLCWLTIRLLEMHRILRDDASLYLHIDRTTHAAVKLALDAIFGAYHCRNEIVWHYKTGGVATRWFSRKHDTILFYSKSASYIFNPQIEKSYLKHKYDFSNIQVERDVTGYYRRVAMRDGWEGAYEMLCQRLEAEGLPATVRQLEGVR